MAIQKEYGTFDDYICQFVNGKTIHTLHADHTNIPATSNESDAMSKALYKRGFKFVGSTICYAYMQAAGMVNDHLVTCFRYQQVKKW
jgi:DNA-3-methyladenine glycosylase I